MKTGVTIETKKFRVELEARKPDAIVILAAFTEMACRGEALEVEVPMSGSIFKKQPVLPHENEPQIARTGTHEAAPTVETSCALGELA